MENIIMHEKTPGRTVHDTFIIVLLHFAQHYFYEFMICKIESGHPRSLIHKLVGEQGIITDYVYMVAICRMDNIVNSDIPVKQPGMGIGIMVLAVEEITAATLRVQVPKHHTKAVLSQ